MAAYSAPAKINLGLEILRKRNDGYHDINSLFVPIPLADELNVTVVARSITMECNDPLLPIDESNLCMRAAYALKKYFSIAAGAHIVLTKNIPAGAGLGGGSSDAATTLQALNVLWNIHAPLTALHSIAATIGSDVPFFLYRSPAIVGGTGERITPIASSFNHPIVVVFPGVYIATAWAYARVVCTQGRVATDYNKIVQQNISLAAYGRYFQNDFEKFIFPHFPALHTIKARLLESGAVYASMTGSGSALFGYYNDTDTACTASRMFSEYRTFSFP